MKKLIVLDRNGNEVNLFQFINIIGIANALSVMSIFFSYGQVDFGILEVELYSGLEMLLNGSMWMIISLLMFIVGVFLIMVFIVKNFNQNSTNEWENKAFLGIAIVLLFTAGVLKLGAPIFYDIGSYVILDNAIGSYIGGATDLLASAMAILLLAYTKTSKKMNEVEE